MLTSFDGEHFTHLAEKGYTMEINHAFFPLNSYLAFRLSSLTGIEIWKTGVILANLYGALSCVLMMKLLQTFVSKGIKQLYATYYLMLNGMIIYSMSFQTESLFTLLFVAGLYVLYQGK